MIKKILSVLAAMSLASPAVAKDPTVLYYSNEAMGCMILRECKEGVEKVYSIGDLISYYPDSDFSAIAAEFNQLIVSLDQIGVEVFLGPAHYFPAMTRGSYHTVTNNFYLNKAFMHRPHVLMSVMRHEGWHAAQDCMAGSIKNSMIAIIKPEESVPPIWREMVEKSYPKSAVPWEAEATWAGKTEGMTQKALHACAAGKMWDTYTPTPLTRKWLVEEGYITK